MQKEINIAMIGYGVIGSAMGNYIRKHQNNVKLFINDPLKGYYDEIYETNDIDAYFIQINVPTNEDGTQNITDLIDIISKIPRDKDIWIRSTITLKSFSVLRQQFKSDKINYLSEFLSETTANDDFENQTMIFTGDVELLTHIFPRKNYIIMTNEEAITTKYFHNVFGALKITFFNCLYDFCKNNKYDYELIMDGLYNTEHIVPLYTNVPGKDGKLGYGGKCFPKDVKAFNEFMKDEKIFGLTQNIDVLNDEFRNR